MNSVYVAGLFGVASIIGATGYFMSRLDMKELKRMELTSKSIQAQEWDKLSLRAILKSTDPDLKTYYIRDLEYCMLVRDYNDALAEFKKTNQQNMAAAVGNTFALKQTLNRLRESPFFKDECRVEFNTLRTLISLEKNEVSCNTLMNIFPNQDFKRAFTQCNKKGIVTIEEAADGLYRKL